MEISEDRMHRNEEFVRKKHFQMKKGSLIGPGPHGKLEKHPWHNGGIQ